MTHPMIPSPFGSLLGAMLAGPAASSATRTLALNAWETEDAYLIEAELPGRTLDDVSVVVHDDVVTLKVAEPAAAEAKDDDAETVDPKLLRRERGPVAGSRSLRLSTPVVSEHTTAVLKDGVLTVRLPKAPEHRPRTIQITGGDDA